MFIGLVWETESEDEPSGDTEGLGMACASNRREIPPLRRPTHSQERMTRKASACCGPAGGGQAE